MKFSEGNLERGAPYSYSNLVELQRQADSVTPERAQKIYEILNKNLQDMGATRSLTPEELNNFLKIDPVRRSIKR